MLSFRLCVAACLLVGLGLGRGGPTALAQSARLTREFQDGVDAFRLGEYDQARTHLEKARDLDPKLPGPYRFLAAVARAEKRFDDCVTQAANALRVAPQSREVPDTRKLHEECRIADGRAAFAGQYGEGGAISVTAQADGAAVGAAVAIDGKSSGSTPLLPRAIPAGSHQVRVSRAGDQSATATVTVLPSVVTDVELVLGGAAAAVEEAGWLELPADVLTTPQVKVSIDGAFIELAPRLSVTAGSHRVTILRRGKKAWFRAIEVTAGKATTIPPIFHDKSKSKPTR